MVIPVPPYKAREGEDEATKRARLLYQSRYGYCLEWWKVVGRKIENECNMFCKVRLNPAQPT